MSILAIVEYLMAQETDLTVRLKFKMKTCLLAFDNSVATNMFHSNFKAPKTNINHFQDIVEQWHYYKAYSHQMITQNFLGICINGQEPDDKLRVEIPAVSFLSSFTMNKASGKCLFVEQNE